MSVDRSLRTKSALERHRNVLTRAERIALLKEQEKWSDDYSAIGMPKVGHRKARVGKKVSKAEAAKEKEAESA